MTSPVGDIGRYTREGRDLDEDAWKRCLYVWNTTELDWERMTQPLIDATDSELYIVLDDLEQYTLDQLLQYQIDSWETDGTDVYVAYEDKNALWYIKKYDTTNEEVTWAVGVGGVPAKPYSNQSYGAFNTKF